ncbi:hypothetical protein OCAR_5267 [Afipia carboxidovorans OM5]|nr:hypothetical protein OCAR_5267 [Afipia carboxidovorans OM5]
MLRVCGETRGAVVVVKARVLQEKPRNRRKRQPAGQADRPVINLR